MNNTYTSQLIDIVGLVKKVKAKSFMAFFLLFLAFSTTSLAQQNRTVNPAGSINAGQKGEGLLTKVDSYDNGVDAMLKKYDKQIYFTQNKGQWPANIRYKADFKFGQALVTDKGMMVGAFDPASLMAYYEQGERQEKATHDGLVFNEPKLKIKGHGWLMNFANASPSMRITNKNAHPDKFNYFYGNGFEGTDVSSYDEVWYNNVYNNVDVRYYPSAEGTLEYDIIVKPGANPANIAINFDGIDKLELTKEGHLVLNTSVGAMDLPQPYAYQMVNGREVKIESAYALNSNNQLTFTLGKYDASKPLIIDPIALRWATWVNSNSTGDNHGHGIWVDPSGNIYMVARVSGSTNFITTGAFDTSENGGVDIIIGKYTEPATVGGAGVRVWQTYIGGNAEDNPYVTELGPDGNLYLAGVTGSGATFPLIGGTSFSGASIDSRSQSGNNAFVLKINPAGNSIKAAVLGGGGAENIFDIRIAPDGDIICGGVTTSTNLNTTHSGSGAVANNNGGNDAWLFRINQNLSALDWMKNFGGSGNDQINILLNNPTTGDIFVAGNTESNSGITAGSPRQGSPTGSSNGFIQRYNSAGTIQWGSYFNSAASTSTSILCMEFNLNRDRVYFAGISGGLGTNNTPSGTYDNSLSGTNDFYIANMGIDQTFYASTYIGSNGSENNLMGLNVDNNNDVYIFGYTGNDGYPTAGGPLQSTRNGSTDKVFSKISSNLGTLVYSTYYGGSNQEEDPVGQRGIKFSNCRIYTIVTAESNNIPLTQGAVSTTKTSSATDIFEPGIVVWANPPDLVGNTITANQQICQGSTPAGLNGTTPSYVLPTIIRNGATSAHPSLGSGITFQWQRSTDNVIWTDISGATAASLTAAQIGSLTQTTHFRRIINGDACVVEANGTITVSVFRITGAQTNNVCFGGTTGTINLTPQSNPSAVTYLWNDGNTSQNRTGLAAGTYSVTATSGGCASTLSFTITQPTQIAFTATPTSATCGAANGSIVFSGVSGGTSPYTYSINGSSYQGGTSFTGVAAGTYTVYVKDAAGCIRTQSVTVSSANALVASIGSQTNVNCFGGTTGSVTLSQTGGTAAYQYQLGSGAFQSSATFSGLTAGTYTFTVRDVNGCTATVNATITQPSAALAGSISSQTNVLCRGNSTGSVTIGATGGTPAYQYKIGSGSLGSSNVFSGLAAGSYVITIQDSKGCTATVNVTITQPASALSGSITGQTNVACNGGNGSVTVAGAGGTAPYQYKIGSGSLQSSGTFSGLTAGTYTVTVQDNNGCTTTVPVTITQPSNLSVSATSQTNVLCFGQSTGAVTVLGSGGTGSYQYKIGSGSLQSSGTFSGLSAGSYTVTVQDANGCTSTVSITITQPAAALSASIGSQTNVLCRGNSTGAVTITATGGTGAYQYQLGSGSFGSSNVFSGLAAGSYVVTVKDANNCTTTVNVIITQPTSPLSGSITAQTNVACNGGNGSVTVAGAGGTAPYQYKIGSGSLQSSGTFSGLAAGSYTVTVQDNNGCTTTVPVTITQPSNLAVSISSQTNVLCFGQSTGAVTVSGSGGATPYQYKIGSGSLQSGATFSGLAAGTYVVTIQDNNGCTSTVSVTITQPAAALSASIGSQTNVLCFGGNNGSVTINVSGGTSAYQYQLGSGSFGSSNVFSGLAAGAYVITVKDNNNCTTTVNVTITQPAAALAATTGSIVNVLCRGNATGSATVTATGGTTGYSYSWNSNPVQTTATATGLAAGTYTVTVTDANGCQTTATATITQPSSNVSGSISSQTNVLCFGNSTGAVTVAGSGGTTPYQYKIGSGSLQSSGTFSGLAAGGYVVTVQDANGCTSTVSVTITQPAGPLAATIGSQTNVLCFGASTGAVTINATGGTSAYQYQLGSGSFGSSATFTGLAAGSYVITVKDANNCTTTVNVTITQPATAVSGSITAQTNVACNGGNGSVTVAGAGGVAPYQYSLNGGSFVTSGTFSNLSAGSYTVTVRDANNCTASVPVTITQPSNLSVSITNQTNVLCFGNSTGAVTVTGNGGTTPYQYQIGSGAFQSSGTFSGLAAGSYTLTVKDANNCTSTVNVTISQPSGPLGGNITSQTNVLCFGNSTGAVTVVATGGTSAYQYKIGSGSFQANGSFTGLAAGAYVVTIQDANGCSTTVNVTITQPSAPLSASIGSQTNVLCFGQSTGSVTIAVAGGTSAYQFKLGNGSYGSGSTFSGLAAGSYVVTVQDANGCTTTVNVTITQPSTAVAATLGSQTNVLCFGNASGAATVVGSGGVAPYTYSINGGSFQSSATFTGLNAGTYSLTVKDANGCSSSVNVTITQPAAPLNATTTQVNASCAGSTNGSITVTATGGTAAYQYQLGSGSFQSSATFSGLTAGTYVITVKDNNNCTTTTTVTITELSSTVLGSITNQTNVLCFGASTGAVTVAGSGGVTPYTYAINGGTFQGSGSFTGLAAGNYFVTVKDANGCLGTVSVSITQPGSPVSGTITNQVNVLCNGALTGAITITGNGGVGPYTYKLGNGSFQSSGIYTGLAAGSYVVTVKDNNGCTALVNVTITEPSTPVAGSIINQTNVLCFGASTGSVSISGSGGVGPYQFNINGGSFSSSNVFSNLAAGNYTVVVKDANGCTTSVLVTITQPASAVSVSIVNQTNADCNGGISGSVTVAGAGGTGAYQYSLNGGAFQSSGAFTGLAAGLYTVVVKDANGCTANVPVNITQPNDVVSGSITGQTNVSCFDGNNGSVSVSGSGGTPAYTYSFNGGAFSSTNSFTGLTAGAYSVTVKDANGCTFVVTVNITQPLSPLAGSITSQTNVSCFGGSNGAVTVLGSGGTAPYQYKIGVGSYQSGGTFNNLAAGTYTVTIRDNKLCTTTVTVIVTQPSTPVAGVADDVTPVACFGDASGSFTVIGSGGVAPYIYSFNSGAFNSSNSYVGLAAGTYTVVVKDANGCTSPSVSVTISQPNGPLSAGIGSQTNILCYGAATGAFTINANGGTAPYQYSLNGGGYNSSNAFTGLTAGIYLVVVRDANGCTTNPVVVTLTQPNAPLSGSITNSTNVLCFGAATGSATVVAVGGVQPYSYSWNTSPAQTGNTATGLTAGTYVVTITDFNGCSITRTVTIAQPATPISASITNITNVSCLNGNNGSATVVASGGTGALSYSWNTNPVQNTATATNLTAGNYVVTITDGNGCSTTRSVSITQPASSVSAGLVSQTNVSCFGDNNGTATISASGGTGAISIVWNTNPQQTGVTATGLTPGSYIATATDANGCSATVSVTITGPAQPLASSIISSTNVTCFGFNNGVAVVSATGGTMPYSYSWSSNPVQTNAVASGLAPGTYTVVITDANGCFTSSNVTITGPAAPVAVSIINQTNVACRGDNSGAATASASGGTGTLSYTWNTVPAQTGPTATGLVAGTYVVTVVDAFGCSANTSVTITQPATVLTAQLVNSVNPTCFGSNNGSATIAVSGGNEPYSIVWNTVPQQTGLTATGLAAGSYVAAVTDQNGCTRFVNVTLTQPAAAMSGSIINSQNVLCFGQATGSATVSVSGGTAPYSYSWNTVPAQTGTTATGLAAGTYIVTATDAQGCSIQRSVTITQPATPISIALVNQNNVTCFGFSNGSATVTAQGGTGALSYVWNTVPQQTGTSATNLVAGTYVVTVTDAFGCFKTLTVTITQPAAPLSAVINDKTNVLCFGQSTGAATVTVSGGTQAYSYSWNTNPVQTTQTASNLAAGTYIVTITDANGCSTTASTVITQPSTPVNASITNSTNVLCYGNATGAATVSAIGGVTPYTYSWNTVPAQTTPTATGLVAGTYNVTVTDANGCSVVRTITITQPSAPLSASISNSVNVCPGFATGSATVAVSGGTANYFYSWNTVPVQNGATASGLAAGTYTVTITDANGCSTTATATINNNPRPNAGANQNICEKVADLVDAGQGQFWTVGAGNPANAQVNPNTGAITGMTTGGVYLFILNNEFGCSDSVTVTTTANCPLIANPDNATTNEDTPVVINVPGNDVDPDGNINNGSVTITDQPDHGTVTINPVTGVVTYTPATNYNGPDSFIYQICDTGLPIYCDTALVTINVIPVNDPPVANPDPGTTPEDTPITINVPGNDTDPEGGLDTTSVTIIDPPGHGTVVVDTTTGDITYTPDPNYNGPDTLIYSICDQGLPVLCDTAIVIINVTPVNDPPIANQDNTTTPEDTNVNINVPGNDTDVDGNLDPTTVTIVDQPNNGTVTVDPVTGVITYDPNPNFNGVDTLIYQVCDTGLPVYCDTALVIINVNPVNDPPVANQDNTTTPEDTNVNINVPGNDTDTDDGIDNSTVTIVDPPSNGTVVVDTITGVITYTPDPNFNGVDTLIYNICDFDTPAMCDTAIVIITVTPVNDPPIANQDNTTTPEDTNVDINVPGNDTDLDGNLDPTTVTIVDQPNNGTVTVDPVTGVITYDPNPNFNGVDTLIYQICDTGLPVLCDTALVIINVTPVNDPPIANQDNTTTPEDTNVDINVPGNDTDVDGNLDPTTVTIVDQPNNGTVTVDPVTGVITYDPNPNFNGVDTLIYQICDTGLPVLCDTALVVINVTPVNDPPIANQDNTTTPEDTNVDINVPGNDTDVDGNLDPTTVTIVDQPNNGTVTVDPVTGVITYDPNPNFNGVDTLIYQICDTGLPVLCDTALVIINVESINDAPVANLDTTSTLEDTPVTVFVPGNDTDNDGNLDNGSVTIVDQPNNGIVVVNPDGSIIYTPNTNFNGVDSLIYQICDLGSPVLCDTAYVVINVTPVNDPPVANQDNTTTPEDTNVDINVPGNDTDVDGNLDPTTVTIVDQPNNGTVTVDPVTGVITYDPNPNFNGVDTLIYQICDTGLPVLCDTALVIINVESINDAPVANLDTTSTLEDTPVTVFVPGNDTDSDDNLDNGSVTIVEQPNNGTVTVDPVTGVITYDPNPNFNGVDTLIYQICDTGLPVLCDTAYVVINVTPVNDPPVANQDNTTTPEDTNVDINVPGNDTDVDGNLDPTTVTIVDQPNNGTVTVDPVTGVITYDPNPNFNGVDTLIYQICDTGLPVLCDTALVIINVESINDAPVANLDTTSTLEDTPLTVFVPGNDTDNDGNLDNGSVTIVDQPNNGIVVVNPDGSIIYTPNTNFNGVDSLIYQICDLGSPVLCDTAYVVINVTPVNDPPVANQDNSSTNEDTPVTIVVPGNDTDVDGNLDNSSVTIVDQPNNGIVVVNPDGSIIYTPNQDFNGVDTLIYQICDTGLPVLCDTALVIINVNPVNDPPIANTDNALTGEDMPVTINLPVNDTDVDGNLDNGSVTIVTPPVNGTVVVNPDGTIIYTPNQDFWGQDSLIYQICDTGLPVLCDTAWVYISVESNNDPLIAILDTASTPEDTPVTIQVPDNDIDVDNNIDYSSVTIILPPANGVTSGIDPVTGFITYTPNLNFNGVDSLIYQICDLGSPVYCDTAWVYITVGPVNDPPVAVTDTASTLEDTPILIGIEANDYDVDGNLDPNSVVIITPPLFGNATFNPANDSLLYVPNPNFFGTDSLLYSICDSAGLCDTAWVYITIQSTPDITLDPSIFPSGNNISCFGANDGSINLTIDLGVPPYTITWTGPNGYTANTEDISGLAPGTYTVIVVDGNGSSITASITLTEPSLLQSSVQVVSYSGGYNVSCGGATPSCDGAIDLSVAGGSPAYSYSWTGPGGFVAVTQDIANLCIGTYTVVVTDANGCTTTQTVTLTAPPALEIGGVALEYNGSYNVSCATACDGSIDLVITGGVAPFNISWTGPNNFASSSEDIANLCPGAYVVTVVDANGCSTTNTITLLAPDTLTSSAAAAIVAGGYNITCNGACNGTINATIGGGAAPYSYSWIGPNGFVAVTEDLSNLCAGTYTLTVTDANGCTSTSSVTLTQPEVLDATALAATTDGGTNISCSGVCDGSIDLTVTGGTAPYTIGWTGPNGYTSSSEDISTLCVGTYVATVTDANGCTSTVTITLTAPTPIVPTGVVSTYVGGYNVSCGNGNNGSIDVSVSGGSGSYSYSWSGPSGFTSNTEDISNLFAGTYTLIVSDVNGCSDTLVFNLTQPEPLDITSVNAPSFCGLANGTLDLIVNGGSGFFQYSWTGPNGFTSATEDLFSIFGGEYIVEVTDTNGCTVTDTIIVGDKPPVVATAVTTPTNCNGNCNGAINLSMTGQEPFLINWTGPNGFTSTDEDLVALCAGDYIVSINDGNGCSFTDTFSITAPNAVVIAIDANNAATCSASNGNIDISATGGSNTYSYSWTGPNGFTSTSQDITGLAAGCYTVTVTDAGGCSTTQTICVGSVSNLVMATVPVNVSCNGLNNGSACANVTGATAPVSYLWSNGANTQCADSLAPGTYVVQVTDASGCSATDTIVITEPDPIVVAADIPLYPNGYNISVANGSDGSIDLTVTGGVLPYQYSWDIATIDSTSEDLQNLSCDTFTVTITDANGCAITEEYVLTCPPVIELPTGFSPGNMDGLNDYYVIHGIETFTDNKFTVFNRWGQVIYEKEGYANDWAGTNFQGRLMPDGVYFVLFTVNVPNQGELTFKATVELRHSLGK
jgi:gliding motility-associated-like protein